MLKGVLLGNQPLYPLKKQFELEKCGLRWEFTGDFKIIILALRLLKYLRINILGV